jgi:hypothetical protein
MKYGRNFYGDIECLIARCLTSYFFVGIARWVDDLKGTEFA